ncbi:MAG: type II secretion system protein GspG [Acidobacteriota bacterium]
MTLPHRRRNGGFSLLELLITASLIALIAAIAIPGLMSAIQRGKQKRTTADLRNLGSAIEEYQIDETYPPAGTGTVDAVLDRPFLVPYYIKLVPTTDGWSNSMYYAETGAFAGATTAASYSVYSFGRYGADDLAASLGEYDLRSFQFDIYFSDGRFTCLAGHK